MCITSIFLVSSISNGIGNKNVKTMGNFQAVKLFPNKSDISIPIVYEGDVVPCDIYGTPLYWTINDQSKHYFFDENNNPVIFNPEPTPLEDQTVELTVFGKDSCGQIVSDKVEIVLKKLYFGDLHWHSDFSDGDNDIDLIYKNAKEDNYLDFTAATDQKDEIPVFLAKIKEIINSIIPDEKEDPFEIDKQTAEKYYEKGRFTTLLGFEWSGSNMYPGGKKYTPNGCEDVSHINFYYKDIYENANHYNTYEKKTYDEILSAMQEEYNNGHLNVGYPHHPQGKIYLFASTLIKNFEILKNVKFLQRFIYDFTTNFTFLANDVENKAARNQIIRGAEIYSRWGIAMGPYSNLDLPWPYYEDNDPSKGVVCANKKEAWAENAMWEWSENVDKNAKFVLQMGSDMHHTDRPGSAFLWRKKPAGLTAAYAVHNTREEIWDAMNNCSIYGTQLLKIRANVRFNGKMALGQWITCDSPLKIDISAMSAFDGLDSSGRDMRPYEYPSDDPLNYPIKEIFIVKKDTTAGQPWCKVIKSWEFNKNEDKDMAVLSFTDENVQPNDFYYIIVKQEAAMLYPGDDDYEAQNEYIAILGPVFIKNVY